MCYKSRTNTTAFHSFVLERQVNIMTDSEESPTRYMLADQEEEGEGVVDSSQNDHSPAKKKKRSDKKKKKSKKIKKEPGKSVQFHPTVTLKTIYRSLKNQIEEINLTQEEEYPLRVTAFALKRKGQKELLKYQHQCLPLTPRRLFMQKHIRDTLQRENGNQSSPSSPPQTLPTNSIQMNS